MKLRNKETGEIGYLKSDSDNQVQVARNSGYNYKYYNSLAELCEEWEDYEEPKVYYYISDFGAIRECEIGKFPEDEEARKLIGNYFETKEEAEKAVEKLKAWKRLKDNGFVFCGEGDCLDTIKFDYGPVGYNNQDFNLLFGGEE